MTSRREALHGRRADPHPRRSAMRPEDPRLSDVDEWGRSERFRALGPSPLRARLLEVVPGPSGRGWRRFPTEGGALLVANHAGAIPSDAPVIMHGIEKELGRPGLRAGRLLLPDRPGRRHALGPGRRGLGPARQRLPAAQGAGPVGPRLPRGDQGALQIVHRPLPAPAVRPRRLRRDRHARRRADHPDRGDRLRRGHAGPLPPAGRGQSCSGFPISRSRPTSSPWGRSVWWCPSRPSSRCGSSIPSHSTCRRTRSATPRAGSWKRPSASAP